MGFKKETAFINFVVAALCAANGRTWGEMGEQVAAEILNKYSVSRKREQA